MTTVKTEIGARDQAGRTSVAPTATLPYTDVQNALQAIQTALDVVETAIALLPSSSVDNTVVRFNGTGGELQGSGITIDDNDFVGGVDGLGVGGATADATNRISANTPAVLFNREVADIQVKLNKEATGDTASFLFQTGFSGRAEIGLVGDDDFQFKTSPDGSMFTTGIVISVSTGGVGIPVALTIPVGASPSLSTDGDLAVDTSVADFSHGLLSYYGGELMGVVSMPIAQFTSPQDGYVVRYNATEDEFELAAPAAGGADTALSNLTSVAINTTLVSDTDNTDDLGTSSIMWRTLYVATSIELGHASQNTLTASAGDLSIEGNLLYRAGGTDVPVTDGGTGASTAQAAQTNLITPLTQVAAAPGDQIAVADASDSNNGKRVSASTIGTGKQSIWVQAPAMKIRTVGPAIGAFSAGSTQFDYYAFDPGTNEDATFTIAMPKGWDEGSVSYRVYWMHPATTTNFGVVWNLFIKSYGNDDSIDGASYTTIGSVTDTGGTTSDLYVSDESSATAVGGAAEFDMVNCIIRREATNGSDTLAVDAYLIGVMVYFVTNANTDD